MISGVVNDVEEGDEEPCIRWVIMSITKDESDKIVDAAPIDRLILATTSSTKHLSLNI